VSENWRRQSAKKRKKCGAKTSNERTGAKEGEEIEKEKRGGGLESSELDSPFVGADKSQRRRQRLASRVLPFLRLVPIDKKSFLFLLLLLLLLLFAA